MAKRKKISDEQYIHAAREHYHSYVDSNDCDIDDGTNVSRGDGGAFITAYLWVDDDLVEHFQNQESDNASSRTVPSGQTD